MEDELIENGLIENEVGSEQAGYLFEFKRNGVFLTVFPSEDNGILFELSDMRQILKEYGVIDYDIQLLAQVVRQAEGVPCRIADSYDTSYIPEQESSHVKVEAQPVDNRDMMPLRIDVSRDRMSAMIHVEFKAGMRLPTVDHVEEELRRCHVVFGIDREAIEIGLKRGRDFIGARGQDPIPGTDAKIEKKYASVQKGVPAKNQYDQVDYKNLNLFIMASPGDILAVRTPHTAGVPGTNVFGDSINAKSGRPKPMPVGKNTELQDENTLIASISGQIIDKGNTISIDPRLEINSDVGVKTGNINFDGGVFIKGSVQTGFSVRATGDIEIKGMVAGGTVEGFNVMIHGGILGMNRGKVSAYNDLTAHFAENAEIEAGGDINITDVVLHSEVRAGKRLTVEGKRGLITGGYVAAGEEIRAKVVGNQMHVATKLVVGVNPMLQRRYQDVCRDYAAAKKKMAQLMKALNTLSKIDVTMLPPERVEQVNQLTRSQFPLAGQIDRYEKEMHQMEEEIAKMAAGKIRVSDTLYIGTKVTINSIIKNILHDEHHCVLNVQEDTVVIGLF